MEKSLFLVTLVAAWVAPSYLLAQSAESGFEVNNDADVAVRCTASTRYDEPSEILLSINKSYIIEQTFIPRSIRMPLSVTYDTETLNNAFIKGRKFGSQDSTIKNYRTEIFIDRTKARGHIFTEYTSKTTPAEKERYFTKLSDCKIAIPKF